VSVASELRSAGQQFIMLSTEPDKP